jgi:hypothetical protein
MLCTLIVQRPQAALIKLVDMISILLYQSTMPINRERTRGEDLPIPPPYIMILRINTIINNSSSTIPTFLPLNVYSWRIPKHIRLHASTDPNTDLTIALNGICGDGDITNWDS